VEKVGLEDVYRLYVNDIYRYLCRLTVDRVQAEDLTQETFFRAYQYLDDYRGEKVRPWLYKAAYHTFVDWHRRRKKRPWRLVEKIPEQPDGAAADPVRTLLSQEAWSSLRTCLDRLPEKQKQVILLHYEQLSYAEIAEVLGIDTGDVKRSLFRGRQKLRRMWRDELDDGQGK
jgi:RNA polymerase sigma-70 factor, ECF subfamily